MSLMGALNTAASGMRVNKIGINVTAHNLTNVNTPGYVRQRVEQSASRPLGQPGLGVNTVGIGQMGTGTDANSIIRVKNSFYDYQFRSESPSYGNTVSKYNYLTNMETVFNEPSDTSISGALNGFFNGFNELSKDPNSVGAKNIAIENAKYLSNSINDVMDGLNTLLTQSKKEQEDMLNGINSDLKELEELTKQINIVQNSGNNPNDLLDRRDMLLDSLSSKIDLNHPDLDTALADGSISLDEINDLGIDGYMKGLSEVQGSIEGYKEDLGNLMTAIANGINDIYNSDLGDGGKDFFVLEVEGGKVVGMSVNKDFVDDPSSLEMTSDKALELMNFKDKNITIDGEEFNVVSYYNHIVQDLGHETQSIVKLEKNQSKLLNSIDSNRWNIAGVSQDEELMSLVQYQHAYNASAKVVSVVDSLLDVVINGMIR